MRILTKYISITRYLLIFIIIAQSLIIVDFSKSHASLKNYVNTDNFLIGLDAWTIKDYEAAIKLWQHKSVKFDADAQYNLATLYETGKGIKQNKAIAANLYAAAARRGLPEAAIQLLRLKVKDSELDITMIEIFSYLKIAAKNGFSKAQFILANEYELGDVITRNYAKAAYWYHEAAKKGLTKAQYNFAVMLDEGKGISKNSERANIWYRRAAEAGNTSAQNNLGYQLEHGHGVKKNLKEAVKWYSKAADGGNVISQSNLAIMYQLGYGVTRNLVNAIYWYKRAALGGDHIAQNGLGLMIANGIGISREPVKAMSWFILASQNAGTDSFRAQANREKFRFNLTDQEYKKAKEDAKIINDKIQNTQLQKTKSIVHPLYPEEMENSTITVQRYLRNLGLYEGKVDGLLGEQTNKSISVFQSLNGLKVNGIISDKLISILRITSGR